ncbi:SNF5/SMARCB1/INI1 protein [Phytophthora cactorum]|nr:SNF5/SMARCB1/INI1 protein [Phytophthora cactorum]
MGFSIPDSPRGKTDAGTQWTEPTLAPSRTGLREGFHQSIAARRRNAIVPGSLSFDALGSPRSPFVFLSQENRRALAQRQEQGQEQQSDGSMTKLMSGGSGDWHSAADRLALFMQRYAVADDKVAMQLGWSEEQLRAYLSPESRRLKAASDIADTAVDKLLMRYRVALAHQTLKSATTKPLMPLDGSYRRSTAPTQFGRNMGDRRSIIHADATPAQLKAAAEVEQPPTGNRKRKRRVIVQPLHTSSAKLKAAAPKEEAAKDNADTGSTTHQLDVRKPQRLAEPELICPIRLDVDLDGVRFQDTFLVNAALNTCSPEVLATQIAQDEKMSDKLKLRDQFEWDISNDYSAAQTFASTLCADLNLRKTFEPAIVFSIFEQVAAYRVALNGRKWIGKISCQVKSTGPTSSAGFIEVMPPLDDVVRSTDDAKLWQPVLSELSREERTYLSARLTAARARRLWARHAALRRNEENHGRHVAQMHGRGGERKETRDHILDMRDRAIADWEEDEARRKGLLASSTLEASAEHFRGLLLENYMSERHEVDMNRQASVAETGEEDEDDDNEVA